MKIRGSIEFPDPESRERAAKVLQALAPDNLRNMQTEITDEKVSVQFRSEKIGSLIATVDDFLMNVKIGEGVGKALGSESEINKGTE
ncbi:MAG: KEOPS complex subunit Pcc1 [Methanosarcinaceae archaeon]|nr:KEOPS complex subunit Pcc1 [Methanosarcinaceae archaeon]